uniref:transposase n=1 Tax=Paraburkholderia sediminicola TaxID=458836 RepID=UPI0038BB3F8C
ATAAVAMMGDPKAFSSGREFAAWAGLVPKQTGSGGKINLHGISKRGDAYLRTLLIHGARAVLRHAKEAVAKRDAFIEIGMEACGGSQHWARKLTAMGRQVKLMPGKFVKAFVMGNKNDAADARAIWMAVQQPCKSVAVKTETQQAVLGLHRMREQLVKFRTMQTNSLRGLLTEYGEVWFLSLPDLLQLAVLRGANPIRQRLHRNRQPTTDAPLRTR